MRAKAYENPTGSSAVSAKNPHGLPANSCTYVIQGGSDEEVAKAIYIKKNPGHLLNGAGNPVDVTVTSEIHPSNSQIITFGRPILIDITAVIELADPSGSLPSNIDVLVQDAIISYANGDLIPSEVGFDSTGFGIGEDVPVRRVDTPINQVIGQYEGAYISTSTINGITSGVVPISFDELSNWISSNISVSVV